MAAYLLGGAVPRGSSPAGWAILQIIVFGAGALAICKFVREGSA